MALKNPGKPHFAAMMLKKGYVQTKDEGFEGVLGVQGHGAQLVPGGGHRRHPAGGRHPPVLAHGILADGSRDLTAQEIGQRVERFKAAGLMGLECYYSTFTPAAEGDNAGAGGAERPADHRRQRLPRDQ